VQATNGNLYGTTYNGGTNGDGTVFEVTIAGTLTTLHSFDSGEGINPYGALVQATNGAFYGTTTQGGGTNNDGTLFSLSVGLGPFVETNPTSAKEGASVKILGNNLTGSTTVSFNSTAATYKVQSSTEITTNVPTGASSGRVTVTTPSSGRLNSNVPFTVLVVPQITSFTPTSGPVGTSVQITGVGLTNTAIITFGGVVATKFTVNSGTNVTATVPTGAKTGNIEITTPVGTAKSAISFKVTE
jgi:uncharacterized repeat protein (TIGR03803 family)